MAIANANLLTPAGTIPSAAVDEDMLVRIRRSDVAVFTRQLASLLAGGMNLAPALTALIEQYAGQPMGHLVAALQKQVQSGQSLSDALAGYPRLFNRLYVSLVQAGQAGGQLDRTLEHVADLLESRAQLASQVRAALVYPAVMACAAAGVVAFLLSYVIPGISEIFLELDRPLPAITRLLVSISVFCRDGFWFIVAGIVAIVLAGRYWFNTQQGRLWWDQWKLRLPLIGPLCMQAETIRFCRTLGILLESGVGILPALSLVREVVQNRYLSAALEPLRQAIGDGQSLAGALKQSGLLAPIVHHTIAVGEMSGQVEAGLERMAGIYEEQLQRQVRTLTTLLEPVIMIVMGVVVGFIVLAMLLPIFEINQTL